jgi:hypothetical protein
VRHHLPNIGVEQIEVEEGEGHALARESLAIVGVVAHHVVGWLRACGGEWRYIGALRL